MLNASNEVAVAAFLEGKISFPDIVSVVSEAMNVIGETRAPDSLEEAERVDSRGREAAAAIVRRRALQRTGAGSRQRRRPKPIASPGVVK